MNENRGPVLLGAENGGKLKAQDRPLGGESTSPAKAARRPSR